MLYERLAYASLVSLLVLGTLGFFVLREPEDTRLTSPDGLVVVSGQARNSQPLVITQGESVSSPLFGQSYQVTPDDIKLDRPVTLAFALPVVPETENSPSWAIYHYQPDSMMWEPVPLVVSSDEQTLIVEVTTLGRFALGRLETVTAPDFIVAQDELRALAPDNTVGYEIAVGYAHDNGSKVRLLHLGETGGCAGQVLAGDGSAQSVVTRQAQVPVNDVMTTLTFVFVGSWVTSSQGGCGEVAPLAPFSPVL